MIAIGTSGYNYPEWRGSFYPEKFPTGKMLPYYAERFSTVEVNYTFYRMPNAKTIAGWVAETPAGFSFTLKAPQRITHFARLRKIGDPLRYFLDTAAGLGPSSARAVPAPAQLQEGPGAARRPARSAPRRPALRDGVPPRELVLGRRLRALRASNAALCVADTRSTPRRSR